MSTSDEWINVINAIENSTRIFLTIIIRFLVFCGVLMDVAGWITRCRLNKKMKDRLTLSRCLLTRWKRDTESPGSETYLSELLEEDERQKSVHGVLNGPIIAHVLTERFDKWFYLKIYAFNDLKIPDQIHHCGRTNSLIILWQTVSSYILRIYFSGSKISTCLRNNETWYNEKNQL